MAPRQGWQGGGRRELDQGGQAQDCAEDGGALPDSKEASGGGPVRIRRQFRE